MSTFSSHPRFFPVLFIALGVSLVGARAGAEPGSLWLGGTGVAPIEQRIAVAVGPARTTIWTSSRLPAGVDPVGLVLPVPAGASVDRVSDAWFEALEVATAPRVLSPTGAALSCDGQPSGSTFVVEGTVAHEPSLEPDELVLLDDVSAVETWATAHGFVIGAFMKGVLSAGTDERFLVARFTMAKSARPTPTFRIALAGASSVLPLALTHAGAAELAVTAWALGHGRASLEGASVVSVAPGDVLWDAATGRTTYREARASALAAEGLAATLVEAASHASLGEELAIASGTASIDSVIATYFERAIGYGGGASDPASCTMMAASVLASAAPVATSCPRNELGGALPGEPCVEAPLAGETDPAKLRCGAEVDDLAVALSGLSPASAWLTRHAMRLEPDEAGVSRALSWSGGPVVTPVLVAGAVDTTGCGAGGAGGGGAGGAAGAGGAGGAAGGGGGGAEGGAGGKGSSAGATGAPWPNPYGGDPSPGSQVIVTRDSPAVGCGCDGTADTVDSYAETESEGCGSDSSESASETSTDDCAGDSSDTGSEGGDSSDTSDDDCDRDSSDTGSDCSVRRGPARSVRLPRLSVMTFMALLVLLPLRRLRRPHRRSPPTA